MRPRPITTKGSLSAEEAGRRAPGSGAVVVAVAGAEVPNAAVLFEPAVQLQLTFPVGLAVHAQASERECLEPSLGDLALPALADAVAPLVDPAERLVDGLNLLAVAVAQDEVDLLVASVAGKVVGIHTLVLALVADLVQVLLDAPEELCAHLFERVPRFLEKRLAHRPTPPPRGG